jgi:hypothetical protein
MGVIDGLRSVGRRLDRIGHVEQLARWWSSATKEARFVLLQRVLGQKAPLKGDPTLKELQLAIYLAEATAGEVIEERGPSQKG